jgi:hypothetical protein
MKSLALLSLPIFLLIPAAGPTYVPKDGYVPDSATAIQIAEAVLAPVYGKTHIESERPFSARLHDGVWTVSGTLHCRGDDRPGVYCLGGVAVVTISQADARILSMIHGK